MADTSAWSLGPAPAAPAAPSAPDTSAWKVGAAPKTHGDDFVTHAARSTWDNVKGAFNLATGADQWSDALDAAGKGNYAEAAQHFTDIAAGPASRMANGLMETATTAAGYMRDAAGKLLHGDMKGADESANAASLHMATVIAPHAEQAAENYKQGNYGAAAGDLSGDALAYLAAKGIHAVPEGTARRAGTAVKEGVKAAAPDVAKGAGKVAVGLAADSMGVPSHLATFLGMEHGAPQIGRGLVKGVRAARDAWTPGPAPEPTRTVGAPQPVTPAEMRTPQFEDVPDVARTAGPEAPPTAGPPRTSRPIGAPAAAPAAEMRTPQFEDVPDVPRRTVLQEIDRGIAGAIPRAETLKPDVARTLKEGAVRENPDGSRQVLQRVPLDKITPDAGNEIYPDVVGSYQRNGYTVHPELRANEEGGLTVQEGHHRLEADKKNGKTDVLAWAPEQPPPGEPGEAAAPAPTPPPPAAPAAPAKAPTPYGKQYITPGQVTRYAADNGLEEADAAAALEKQGVSVVDRASTNRVLHGIGAELGYDHGTLSEIAHATYGKGLGKITHEQMMELAEKLGNEQGTKEPLAKKRTGSPADTAIAAEAEGAPQGGVIAQLATGELHADPVRFQYKAGMGQGGAGEELRSVTTFDPEKSGILSVWKDPADGKTYVVNGHHRLELAQRTGAKELTVRYLDAATAEEARAKGAMINIAEGRGTSIDAAKVFRDAGATADDLKSQGLSLTGSVAKEGQALANLEPNLFNQVVSGEMKPARGAMIGQVAEHADQRQLVKLIQEREASGRPMTDGQVGELLRMQAPQITETQHSLFGDDEISRSLIAEKAGVSDYIQSRLTQKRRTFNAVGNERAATRLAEAGNVIDADKNAAIAEATNQEHAVYQKLSTSTGPVADALDQAAKDLHAGENPAIVKVRTYAKIEPILKAEADKLTGRGSAPGQRSEGSAQPGSDQAGRGKHDQQGAAAEEDLEAPLRESIKNARNTSDLMR